MLNSNLSQIDIQENEDIDILFVDVMRTNYTSSYRKAIVGRMIPKIYKEKIEFITHFSEKMKSQTSQKRMKEAKLLLDRYKKAKVVFTSYSLRITLCCHGHPSRFCRCWF